MLLTDPAAITAESFRRIDALLAPYGIAADVYPVVRRVVHTTADTEWVGALRFAPGAIAAAIVAIRGGANIVTDVQMVAAGIQTQQLARFGGTVCCAIDHPEAAILAQREGITRSMAAIRLLAPDHPQALYIVGNAPTALYEVVALAHAGAIVPPVIVGVPVGFVATVESKTSLMHTSFPWISNVGPKGGSAVAAAIVNALLALATEDV